MLDNHPCPKCSFDEPPRPTPLAAMKEVDEIATAIQMAALNERESCARHLERSAQRFPDQPHLVAVLCAVADDLRNGKHA